MITKLIKTRSYVILLIAFGFFCNANADDLNYDADIDIPLSIGSGVLFGFGTALRFGVDADPLLEISQTSLLNKYFDNYMMFQSNRSLATLSDYLLGAIMISPIINSGLDGGKNFWQETLMYAQVGFGTVGLNLISKDLIKRDRPMAIEKANGVSKRANGVSKRANASDKESFYSGHTTVAFASAVYLSLINEQNVIKSDYRGYYWATSLVIAGTIGILRVASGKHYVSDVIIGALVGSAIAWATIELHKSREVSGGMPLNSIGFSFKL